VTDHEPWPRWASEPVQIEEPDPNWRERGSMLATAIAVALAPWLTRPVEHVGSTSVPGLAAKPVIDLQAATADLDCAEAVAIELAPTGWHFVPPELDQHPWRRFFVLVKDDRRAAHLHLIQEGQARWDEQIAFRDALRTDARLVTEYADLKRDLAVKHRDDREAYTQAKAAFIRRSLMSS
jgi:GrpB-like predicted nucleotidyltransferase (UPF0157 family)